MQALQIVISGMAQGCIYGLIALGLVLIYKTTETVSFAQGELMMLGAFAGFALMTLLGWPFWLAMLMTIAVLALFGFGLERIVIRPILGQPAFSLVMLTRDRLAFACASHGSSPPVKPVATAGRRKE